MGEREDKNVLEYRGGVRRGGTRSVALVICYVAILGQIPWIVLAGFVAVSLCGTQSFGAVVFVGAFACAPSIISVASGIYVLVRKRPEKTWEWIGLSVALCAAFCWVAFAASTLHGAPYIECP
jgi:hypothetical protein